MQKQSTTNIRLSLEIILKEKMKKYIYLQSWGLKAVFSTLYHKYVFKHFYQARHIPKAILIVVEAPTNMQHKKK